MPEIRISLVQYNRISLNSFMGINSTYTFIAKKMTSSIRSKDNYSLF